MNCKCEVCGLNYEYDEDRGYSPEECSSFCDGVRTGMKRKQKEIDRLRATLESIQSSAGSDGCTHSGDGHAYCRSIAVKALEGTP